MCECVECGSDPFNDKDVSRSLASLLQSPQYNLEMAMAAMDRNCGALANITRYHKIYTTNTFQVSTMLVSYI